MKDWTITITVKIENEVDSEQAANIEDNIRCIVGQALSDADLEVPGDVLSWTAETSVQD